MFVLMFMCHVYLHGTADASDCSCKPALLLLLLMLSLVSEGDFRKAIGTGARRMMVPLPASLVLIRSVCHH